MNVEEILPWVFRFENFLENNKFEEIKKRIENLKFLKYELEKWKEYTISSIEQKIDYFNVEVFYFKEILFIDFFSDINKEFDIIRRFCEKVYNEKLYINNMWAIIKMKKWKTLWVHADDHSTIQWVIHTINWSDNESIWWNLSIFLDDWTEKIIIPKENSVIVFRWDALHAVRTYMWDIPRISIPFGFDNENLINKKKKDWIKCLQDLKICNDNTIKLWK